METTTGERGTSYNVEALKAVPIEDLLRRLDVESRGRQWFCPSCKPAGRKEHKRVNLSTGNNRFYCHTCGARGDTIELVTLALKTDFKGACDYLSREFGVPMKDGTRRGPARRRRPRPAAPEPKRETPADVSDVLEDLLRRCTLTGEALNYCAGRGWSRELLARYDVKAIDDPARIFRELTEAHGIEALKAAGLVQDSGRFHFAGHRLLFPFYARRSFRVEYVQARRIDGDREPKYLGARRPIPCLWNDLTLANVGTGGRVFVTEGIPDALSLSAGGLDAVAVIGTGGLSASMIRDLLRFDVVLCGDRDEAGRKFNREGVRRFAQHGVRARPVLVPEGFKDWNEYATRREAKR